MRRHRVHLSNGRHNSYWGSLSAQALLVCMQYLQFILEGSSNKELDAFSKELVDAIRKGGSIKSGPIAPSKGKRLVYCYGASTAVIGKLMAINANKYKKVKKIEVNQLSFENPQ